MVFPYFSNLVGWVVKIGVRCRPIRTEPVERGDTRFSTSAIQVTVLKTNGGRAYTETIYFLTLTHDISAAL